MERITWIVMVAALVGTWINIKQDHRCFYIWSVTNTFFCIYNASHEQYAQAFLFAVYFVLAVVGIVKWRK